MKAYKVTLTFDVSIVDVERERKRAESEKARNEAVEVHKKLMATKEAARKEADRNENRKN